MMGRNKKGVSSKRAFRKDPVATKMASGVKKTKTKPVVTNLKKMNFQNRARTEAVDAEFSKLQQQKQKTATADKPAAGTAKAEAEKVIKATKKQSRAAEEPDTAMAIEEFSKMSASTS